MLSAKGYELVLNGLGGSSEIDSAMEACQRSGAPGVRHHGADLSDPKQISEMFSWTADTCGRTPDVLVNNAGE